MSRGEVAFLLLKVGVFKLSFSSVIKTLYRTCNDEQVQLKVELAVDEEFFMLQ